MIFSAKCANCKGAEIPFRKLNGRGTCPVCGETVTLKSANPQLYEELSKKKDEIKSEFGKIADGYKDTGSKKDVLTCVQSYSAYKDKLCDEDFFELWRVFVLDVAGIAAERGDKKDKELQLQLKSAAKTYDNDNPQTGQSLYADVIRAYPNLGNDDDWNDMIQQTQGDRNKFTALRDMLITYIAGAKDKAFAMDKFYLFAAKEAEWAEAGGMYLRALFNNEEIAENVFGVSSFTPKTKKFIRKVQAYCNKYLSGENTLSLSETKVWANYETACRRQRKRNIIIISAVAAAALAVGISLFLFLNSVNPDTVEFNIDNVIEVTYGDEPSLSDYTVTYKKRSGAQVSEPITMKMLSGYDPEKIGTQTVYVQYSGKQKGITIRLNPAPIQTPVLTRSGNSVTWDFVPNATDYELYINNMSTVYRTLDTLSYDLSEYDGFGELSVIVRAVNPSEKYENSAMSQALAVTKLQSPQNLVYENGRLTWNEVEGADSYELAINGSSVEPTTNNYLDTQLLQGANDVKIVAKSADGSAVDGVTSQSLYRLSPVTNVSYSGDVISWEAETNANQFEVYVGGALWKTFTRKNFNLTDDEFTSTYHDNRYTIGIVCKSTVLGNQPSDKYEFDVSLNNHAAVADGMLKWNAVASSAATYVVKINGQEFNRLSSPTFSLSQGDWTVGDNTVSITAEVDGKTVIMESATVRKLASPELAVSGGNWTTDGNEYNRYKINGGGWETTLKSPSELEAGEYTISAKRITSSATALEVESDEVTIKVHKLAKPVISMLNHQVTATYDSSKYTLSLEYSSSQGGEYTAIASLAEIITAGDYWLRAKLSAIGGKEDGFDVVIPSEVSTAVQVKKLAAPTKINYNDGDLNVSAADGTNVKYYYRDKDGTEHELTGGLIANLPQGIFEIYGRSIAQNDDELDSENTPENGWAHVFNMKITLTISKYGTSQSQIYVVFGGCGEIDSLEFTFKLEAFDSSGTLVGHKEPPTKYTVEKRGENPDNDKIVTQLNYRDSLIFEQGKGQTDVYKIKLTISLKSGDNEQALTAELVVA